MVYSKYADKSNNTPAHSDTDDTGSRPETVIVDTESLPSKAGGKMALVNLSGTSAEVYKTLGLSNPDEINIKVEESNQDL